MSAHDHRLQRNREARTRALKAKPWVRWYGTKGWKAKRAAQLAKEPQCAACIRMKVFGVLATVADHVIPHRGDRKLFWEGKLQSLCKPCHDGLKQAEEAQGYSKAVDAGEGWPLDKAHPFNAGKIPKRTDSRRKPTQ